MNQKEHPLISIPFIGLGTYRLNGKEGIKVISEALELGYKHLDTAAFYHNEVEVGSAVKQSSQKRDNLFITTKIWPEDFDNVLKATETSLKKLQMDDVDLLLLHWPSDEKRNSLALHSLNDVLQKGYAKNVGVSNFNIHQLSTAKKIAPVICNQVEYHPYLSQQKMLTCLKKEKMFCTAYRPIANGKVADDPVLKSIAYSYKKTPAQISLRWLIQQDVVAIPKTSSLERLKENISIFDFTLTEKEMKAIFSICNGTRQVDSSFSPEWDE